MQKRICTVLLLIGFTALMPVFPQSRQAAAPDAKISDAADDDAVYEEELPSFNIGVDVSMVSVPVTVRRADGSFYRGLTQKSFRIREDGKEQKIVSFAQEGLSTHVAIVLDISGSVKHEWGTIKYATKRFLENLRPDDYFSLTTFNNQVLLKMDWGKNTEPVDAKLTSVYCKDLTKIWDAVWVVSTEVFKGIDGKKAMIIMSDGLDNDSMVSYAEAVTAAVENGIAIYVVSKTEALRQYYEYSYPDFPQYVLQQDLAQAEAVLRRLAYDTGGRVLKPNSFGQLDDIYAGVYEELRNQYTLGYISTNTVKDGSYREIDIAVSRRDAPNVTITARPGYYAPRK